MPDSPPNTSEPLSETDLVGRQLGDFRLLRRLGRGAMAEVFLAEQSSLRRQVAIKVLRRNLAADEVYIRRFHNEAQAAAALVHANIVQIHEVGQYDGIHYIVQEYVPGQNLQELMTRRGLPDLKLALAIMRQVAAALAKAAAAGIVHRDIKPENIMLARSGEVKVADFGLARLAVTGAAVNLTQIGMTMGTPLYMSPEQVEGRALDPRSDIYSFGVTCFHMLAGKPPFEGDTPLSVAYKHVKSEPPRLEEIRPDLPVTLCRIVHRMLAKEPGERFENPRDLLRELRGVRVEGDSDEWADELDEADGSITSALAEAHAATQRLEVLMKTSSLRALRRRRRWAWVSLAALAAFAIGGVAGWASRPRFLLADARATQVPKQETVEDQLLFAQMESENSEEWLQSVEKYFPQDEYHIRRAQQDLARLYLRQDRWADALEIFDEFARLDDSQPEFRAFGLAGQSIVLTWQGQFDRAPRILAELWPMLDELDPRMGRLIRATLETHRNDIEPRASDADKAMVGRWLEADFGSDEAEEPPGG